jgi:hypothetical protein
MLVYGRIVAQILVANCSLIFIEVPIVFFKYEVNELMAMHVFK